MGNAEETKRRLLAAAKGEFAEHGFSGARVDRIAGSSGCNKQAIYGYFANKEGLFEAVYNEMVIETIEAVPLDVTNLPKYAGRLFDHYQKHPEVLRLAFWYQLERAHSAAPPVETLRSMKANNAAVAAAQKKGLVNARMKPEHLMAMVIQMSTVGFLELGRNKSGKPATTLRQPLIDAVSRLVAP